MKHFELFFYVLSLFSGVSSISISIFVYLLYKKKSVFLFTFQLLSLFLIQLGFTMEEYLQLVNETNHELVFFRHILDYIGTNMTILVGPFFLHSLLGYTPGKIKRRIFLSISALSIFFGAVVGYGLYTGSHIINEMMIAYAVLKPALFGIILYNIVFVLRNLKSIGDKNVKQAMIYVAIVTLIFLPIFIFEPIINNYQLRNELRGSSMFSVPLYFIIINFTSLFLSIKHFNQPVYMEENKLTKYFIDSFGITQREQEIILLVIEGKTYKDIAAELFIAYKTVDTHIQSIYRKLEVRSKIQLVNLLNSNTN